MIFLSSELQGWAVAVSSATNHGLQKETSVTLVEMDDSVAQRLLKVMHKEIAAPDKLATRHRWQERALSRAGADRASPLADSVVVALRTAGS
jgi:hypothetical protein